jgi:hypothetical protein
VHGCPVSAGRPTPKPGDRSGGEATVNACGVAVAMLLWTALQDWSIPALEK